MGYLCLWFGLTLVFHIGTGFEPAFVRTAVGKVGSNLGPNTDKVGPKPCAMTQHKARRTNQIAFLPLPWAQEVSGSNPDAPTTYSCGFNELLLKVQDSQSCPVPAIF